MATTVTYTVRDAKSLRSSFSVNLPSGVGAGDVAGFASALATIVDPMLGGVIESVSYRTDIGLPGGLKVNAGPTSDVEEGARFTFRTTGNFLTAVTLPAINEAIFAAGSANVNYAAGTISADFVDAMVDGIDVGGTTIQPTDAREEDIVSLDAARNSFTRTRRGG